jgi:hypothetical protein
VSNTATLQYTATATGPTVPANLETAMAAVELDESAIETVTGCTLTSDVTTLVGSVATRTIIFGINNATFQGNFPAGTDQASPFRALYGSVLSAALACPVTEIPVVIA